MTAAKVDAPELDAPSRPIAALASLPRDKKHRHALPIDRSDGPAFCGVHPRFEGWENLGTLSGKSLPAFGSGYCHDCILKARQLIVLRIIQRLGSAGDFSGVRGLSSPLDDDRELNSILVDLVGNEMLQAEIQPEVYPNRVLFRLTTRGLADLASHSA